MEPVIARPPPVHRADGYVTSRARRVPARCAVSLLGFGVSASDGFTTSIEHDYVSAPGSKTTYICAEDANVAPTAGGILYNTYP